MNRADTTAAQSGSSKPAFEPITATHGSTYAARMPLNFGYSITVSADANTVLLQQALNGFVHGALHMGRREAAATGRELLKAAGADHSAALLEAVRRLLPWPFTVPASHAEMVEFWQREHAQGNGYAADALFALAAIAAAEAQQ